MNQLGTIVDGDDLDSLWQTRLHSLQTGLHAVDHFESVFPAAHDHHSGDNFSGAVQVGDSATQVRPFDNFAQILHANRRAIRRIGDDNVLEVVDGGRVTPAAHHVLGPAEVEQSRAGFVVSFPHCVDDLRDGDSIALQAVRVEIHLDQKSVVEGKN